MAPSKPQDRRPGVSRQQPPLSCDSCRTRKLRCGRGYPCSNCEARGIPCRRAAPEAMLSADELAPAATARILRRLDALEATLSPRLQNGSSALTPGPAPTPTQDGHLSFSTLPSSPAATQGQYPPFYDAPNTYTSWLYRGRQSSPKGNLSIQSMPINQIQIQENVSGGFLQMNTPSSIIVYLPTHSEAQTLVEKYIKDVQPLYHVLHPPTLEAIVKNIYTLLTTPDEISLEHLALVVSVFSASAYYGPSVEDKSDGNFSMLREAHRTTAYWAETAHILIGHCWNVGYMSLEVVQASVTVMNIIGAMEGPSHRYRCLLNQTLTMAQELKLHVNDHIHGDFVADHVQKEVRRRVWWYLATTDWLLSGFDASHETTSKVDPQQMAVNLPQQLDGEIDAIRGVSLADPRPRDMSFFLNRIRLSQLFRQFKDRNRNLFGCPSYGDVMQFDIELDRFINGLPPHLHPRGSRRDTANEPTNILIQRYLINSLANTQRCKLHLPYLAQGFTDATYAYSRTACLTAARLIIQAEKEIQELDIPFVHTRMRSAGYLSGIFIANMALSLELCLRWTAGRRCAPGPETREAFQMLCDASGKCASADMLLQSITKSLQDHGILSGGSLAELCASEPGNTQGLRAGHPHLDPSSLSAAVPGGQLLDNNATLGADIPLLDLFNIFRQDELGGDTGDLG